MFQLCRHIKTNGKRCQSPALGELAYCYYHARTHSMASPNYIKFDDLKLPLLEDSASIQIACVWQVVLAHFGRLIWPTPWNVVFKRVVFGSAGA